MLASLQQYLPLDDLAKIILATIVDEHHVRPELFGEPDRLGAARGGADDIHPLAFEKLGRGVEEEGVVVDDKNACRHWNRIPYGANWRIPATGHLVS
jgi:hypothetical protein